MVSRDYFIRFRQLAAVLAIWLPVLMGGCASRPVMPEPAAAPDRKVTPPAVESTHPQQAAARELTNRGRRHLENNRPDAALRDLERALSLNPSAGENYYYLAEAWLMKIDARRAREFNRMAEDHFKKDPDWLRRSAGQADRSSELEQ